MPFKSDKQKRAMYAAASGKSTLGIPAGVAREFIQADKQRKQARELRRTPR